MKTLQLFEAFGPERLFFILFFIFPTFPVWADLLSLRSKEKTSTPEEYKKELLYFMKHPYREILGIALLVFFSIIHFALTVVNAQEFTGIHQGNQLPTDWWVAIWVISLAGFLIMLFLLSILVFVRKIFVERKFKNYKHIAIA